MPSTWYVWAGATGANDGTSLEDAFQTIGDISGVASGDTVLFYRAVDTPQDVLYDCFLGWSALDNLTIAAHPDSPLRPVLTGETLTSHSDWSAFGEGVFNITLADDEISTVLFNYGATRSSWGQPCGLLVKAASTVAVAANGNGSWFYEGASEAGTKVLSAGIPDTCSSGQYPTDASGDGLWTYMRYSASALYNLSVGSGCTIRGLEIRCAMNAGNVAGYNVFGTGTGNTVTDCLLCDGANHNMVLIGGSNVVSGVTACGLFADDMNVGVNLTSYSSSSFSGDRYTDCTGHATQPVAPDCATFITKNGVNTGSANAVGAFYCHTAGGANVISDLEYRRCVAQGHTGVRMLNSFGCGNPSTTGVSDRFAASTFPVRCYDCKTLNGNGHDLGSNQAYVRHTFNLPRCKDYLGTIHTSFDLGGASARICLYVPISNATDQQYTLLESCTIFADQTGTTFAPTGGSAIFGVHTYDGAVKSKASLILRGCTVYMYKGSGSFPAAHAFLVSQDTNTTPTSPTIDAEQCVFATDATDAKFFGADFYRADLPSRQLRFRNNWYFIGVSGAYSYGTAASPGNHWTDFDSASEWKASVDTATIHQGQDPQLVDPANGDLRPIVNGALALMKSAEAYQQGSNPSDFLGRPYNGRFGAYQPRGGASVARSRSVARRT